MISKEGWQSSEYHNHQFGKRTNFINLAREPIWEISKVHSNYSSGLIISIIRNQMDNLYLVSVFEA